MERTKALTAFAALSQDVRLDAFRALVRAGQDGLTAGEIADLLKVRPNTLSTNLALLHSGGLVTRDREGRSMRYRADFGGVKELLSFLLKDCCGGQTEQCAELLDSILMDRCQ